MILAMFVDDMIIVTSSTKEFINLKSHLSSKFEIKDLGKINYCLGVEFRQNRESKSIFMSQKKYIKYIIEKFRLQDANTVQTAIDANVKLIKELMPQREDERKKMEDISYQRLIGSW